VSIDVREDFLGIKASVAMPDCEGDRLSIGQLPKSVTADVCVVNEHVLPRAILSDETVTLRVVEPTHCPTYSFATHLQLPVGA
jgi:hypothetical protein